MTRLRQMMFLNWYFRRREKSRDPSDEVFARIIGRVCQGDCTPNFALLLLEHDAGPRGGYVWCHAD
jgi:hypothetical protein